VCLPVRQSTGQLPSSQLANPTTSPRSCLSVCLSECLHANLPDSELVILFTSQPDSISAVPACLSCQPNAMPANCHASQLPYQPFAMTAYCHACYFPCQPFAMSAICHVSHLPWQPFAIPAISHASHLPCQSFAMPVICHMSHFPSQPTCQPFKLFNPSVTFQITLLFILPNLKHFKLCYS